MTTIKVSVINPVNGGTPVPNDWNKFAQETVREIRPVPGLPLHAKLFAGQVAGQSLQKVAVLNGDWLIIHKTTRYELGSIGIWDTPHGRTAKYAHPNKNGSIVLHNNNGWRQEWATEEVALFGVVVRVERDMMP
jgi:SOS-response transcriptional repressor LexA